MFYNNPFTIDTAVFRFLACAQLLFGFPFVWMVTVGDQSLNSLISCIYHLLTRRFEEPLCLFKDPEIMFFSFHRHKNSQHFFCFSAHRHHHLKGMSFFLPGIISFLLIFSVFLFLGVSDAQSSFQKRL